ncbi:hypothetical protein M413DRAFT_324344 [Hebeloma cylindrosporum]|uniref:DUF6534 domain-containing protein n=1 Tax=Hebeloma cylindrosporum TaxID=76867 RepID=A0A0C3BGL3_HEBCY|nr:hypothetical protein M413DRAFT_324344 [Hebeloma cylindrosporum h7]
MVAVTLGNTMGAAFLGVIGSSILFGAIAVQVFMYYTHFPNDWKLQKISVAILMAMAVVHLVFGVHAVYFYVILNFGKYEAQKYIAWSFKLQTSLDVAIVLFIQALYAWRVQTLGKHFSRVWPWVVIGIVGVGWIFGIMLAVRTYQTKEWASVREFHWVLFGSLAFATSIDFVIAVTICYYLRKSHSVFTTTNNRILKIMHYTLVCGFFTSICSSTALICLAIMPNTLVFIGIDFLLPRLYMNSYMALLNARRIISEQEASSFNMTGVFNNFRSQLATERLERKTSATSITVETEIISDQCTPQLTKSSYLGGKADP